MSREHNGEQTFIAAQDPPNQPSRARSSPSAADSSKTEHLPLPMPHVPLERRDFVVNSRSPFGDTKHEKMEKALQYLRGGA